MNGNNYFTLIGTRLLYKSRRNAYWRDTMTGKKVFIQKINGKLMYRDDGADVWHPIEETPKVCAPTRPMPA